MGYTTLLLVPDYLADEFGHDTVTWWSSGDTAEAAVVDARNNARDAYALSDDDRDDFHVLAVYVGHLVNVNPEA